MERHPWKRGSVLVEEGGASANWMEFAELPAPELVQCLQASRHVLREMGAAVHGWECGGHSCATAGAAETRGRGKPSARVSSGCSSSEKLSRTAVGTPEGILACESGAGQGKGSESANSALGLGLGCLVPLVILLLLPESSAEENRRCRRRGILCKHFLPFHRWPFCFVALQKLLSLIRSHLFILAFTSFALRKKSKTVWLPFMPVSVLPTFSSKEFCGFRSYI